MATVHYLAHSSEFRTITLRGMKSKMDDDRDNLRARLTNRTTGKREDLIYFDPQDEVNEYLLASDFQIELKADIHRALRTFSPIEQRIIVRVVLQGQSMRDATRKTKCPRRTWTRWLSEEALPRLRTLLHDYKEELSRKGNYNPKILDLVESANAERFKSKCKFCTFAVVTKDAEQSFNTLKKHIKKEHPAAFAPVNAYAHAKDYDIHMLESRLSEPAVELEDE